MAIPTLKTLLSLRTKLVIKLMTIPYDTIDKVEMAKMNKLISDIQAVNLKIPKTK